MSGSRSTRPILLTAFGLLVFGGGLFALLTTGGGRAPKSPPRAPSPLEAEPDVADAERRPDLIPVPRVIQYEQSELAATTVLWPLRLELDLIEASYLPSEVDMAPIGSGATARLKGHVLTADDVGARATIRFVAGSNEGRVLRTDVTGSFGASDLFPGLSIVEIAGSGLIGSRREIRLRQNKDTLLNVTYGAPGRVTGVVQDRAGTPIEGARVRVDGIRTTTGPDGVFFVSAVAAGQLLLEVEHHDYASYQELIWVASGRMAPKGRLTCTLDKGASLRVAVTNNVGGPGPIQLILLPGQFTRRTASDSWRNMRYPYHSRNPIEIQPGGTLTITGLRAETVQVFAFRAGAETTMKFANLRLDRPYDLKIQMRPAPKITGKVTRNGEPVMGAEVVLEAPNKVRATLAYLKQANHFLETAVMPSFPPAHQSVTTDKNGRFVMTAWEAASSTRYLEARGPSGITWAGVLVHPGEYQIDLELGDVQLGESELVLEFPDRFQGIPIELLIDGTPLDPWILAPNEDLHIGDLLSGEWRMKLTWHSQLVHEELLTVLGTTEREVQLPPECIDGQDAEAWRRAGREYPSQ